MSVYDDALRVEWKAEEVTVMLEQAGFMDRKVRGILRELAENQKQLTQVVERVITEARL